MLAPNMATMLAVLTTDAAVEPDALAEALAPRRAELVQRHDRSTAARRPTTPCSCWRAGGRTGRRPRRCAPRLAEACADLARQMVGDAEGATKVVTVRVDRRRHRRGGAVGGPQGGREPAGEVLVVRRGPVLGPDRERARAARASPSTPTWSAWPTAARSCAGRHRGRRTTRPRSRPTWPGANSTSTADLGLGDGHGVILTNDLTHAYIDENMGTS